jgi:hypothetical protein
MPAATLLRVSGLALLVGGALGTLGLVLHPPGHDLPQQVSPTWVPAHGLILLGWLLVILGLPGFYASQASRAGWLGLAAVTVALIGAALRVGVMVYEIFVAAALAPDPIFRAVTSPDGPLEKGALGVLLAAVMIASGVGSIMLGWVTLRVALLSRRAAGLLIAGGVLLLGGPLVLLLAPAGFLLASIALAWLGYAHFRHVDVASSEPSRVLAES